MHWITKLDGSSFYDYKGEVLATDGRKQFLIGYIQTEPNKKPYCENESELLNDVIAFVKIKNLEKDFQVCGDTD